MKNQITKSVKTESVIASNNNDAKKKIVDLNLSQFADKLKNVEVKEKKDKNTIYVYPDGYSKSDINSEKGKKFRNSLRTKILKFENNIFVFAKTQDNEKLIASVNEFNAFYKANYATNDYSLKSISSSNNDAKGITFQTMLDIIVSVNNAQIEDKAPTIKTKKINNSKSTTV